MANRRFKQFSYTYQQDVVLAFSKITFGASGAPTLTADPCVKSIVRNSAGNYTLTLNDKFFQFLSVNAVFNTGSTTAPAAPGMFIQTDSTAAATPTLRIIFNAAGTPTDPASGEVVLLEIYFKNSSVKF